MQNLNAKNIQNQNVIDSGEPASYTRRGLVLYFFYKPDVCYYGRDGPDKIVVWNLWGKQL